MSKYVCPVPGCGRPSRAKTKQSMCARCQASKHQGREVGSFGKRVADLPCTVDGCARKQYAKDLCNMHWRRQRTYGFTGPAEALRFRWADNGVSRRPEFLNRDFDVPKTVEGIWLRAEYEEILRQDPCVFCGAPSEHIDHIEAFARGGSSEWDNMTAACKTCNLSKGTWSLLDFLWLQKERAVA